MWYDIADFYYYALKCLRMRIVKGVPPLTIQHYSPNILIKSKWLLKMNSNANMNFQKIRVILYSIINT